ncbi:tetratricopeptide repeat protein [Alteromonadaceae bacterium M269]|nr:tetratricopeptide repeat protein [Alteromonadaceae bacterium M269]
MRKLTYLLLITLVTIFFHVSASEESPKKVLMVVSSYGEEKGNKKPGFEFDEFAKAYLVFSNNNIEVDVASPKGGPVEADQYDPNKPYNQLVLADKQAMEKLNESLPTNQLVASNYDAVFIVGGKGAMFDLPKDTALQSTIADIYQQQGVVSAVCHGPAALTNVKLSDGSYLVSGKTVNGFTNIEEKAFGKKWLPHFEFLLEDQLKARGGIFESAPMMLKHVAVDGRLITGQNPFSTTSAANQVVRSLGLNPIESVQFSDDMTIDLVTKIMHGDSKAATQFNENVSDYQPELVGMYGYFAMQQASDNSQLHQAIELMSLAAPHMQEPRLNLAIAQGYQKLGNTKQAVDTLQAVLKNNPDMEQAQTLLAQLRSSNSK